MQRLRWLLVMVGLLGGMGQGWGATARLVKVLPHLTDRQGRVALNPSLYERDAYQLYLRKHPEERGGMRFDVQWKSPDTTKLTLRLELRGNLGKLGTTRTLEQVVKHQGLFNTWSALTLTGEAYEKFGELSAWRATLWLGDRQLAEQKSFLW